jgi:hypothetical protein
MATEVTGGENKASSPILSCLHAVEEAIYNALLSVVSASNILNNTTSIVHATYSNSVTHCSLKSFFLLMQQYVDYACMSLY